MSKYAQSNEVDFLARYKKNMKKIYFRRRVFVLGVLILLIFGIVKTISFVISLIDTNTQEVASFNNLNNEHNAITSNVLANNTTNLLKANETNQTVLNDWRIRLANLENVLPEDFTVELADIDEIRQFDKRAIDELMNMVNDMREDGITNVWVQSAYRSVERQEELYNNSIAKYLKEGKSRNKAEELTLKYINKPGASDHNLGLAVDFNNVDNDFESSKAFKWLSKYAENYGFVLRYPKDKVNITGIEYESWHWRYVGVDHAKKMNDLGLCLEEYVEYLVQDL